MTGLGQLSIARNMSLIRSASATFASNVEIERGAHPVDVRAAAEDVAFACEHDRANVVGRRDPREDLVQPRDDLGVEGVAHLGPRERDAGDPPVTANGNALGHGRARVRGIIRAGLAKRYTREMKDAARPAIYRYAFLTRASHWLWVARVRRAGRQRPADFQRVAESRRFRQERPRTARAGHRLAGARRRDDDDLRAYVRHDGVARLDRRRDGLARRARVSGLDHDSGLSRSGRRPALASLLRVDCGAVLAGVAGLDARSKAICAR